MVKATNRSDNTLLDGYHYLMKQKYAIAFCDGNYLVGAMDGNISGRFGVVKLAQPQEKHTIKLDSNIPVSGEVSIDATTLKIKSGRKKLTLTLLGDRLPRLDLEEYCESLEKAKLLNATFAGSKEASKFETIHFVTHQDKSYVAFASPHMLALVPDSIGLALAKGATIASKDASFIDKYVALYDEASLLITGETNNPKDGFNVIQFQDQQSRQEMIIKIMTEFDGIKKQKISAPIDEIKGIAPKNYNTVLTSSHMYLVEEGKSQITVDADFPYKTPIYLNFEPFKLCLEFMERHKDESEKDELVLLTANNDRLIYFRNRQGCVFVMLMVREFNYEAAH